MPGLHKGSLNIIRVHLVQHALYESLDGVFCRAEGPQAGRAERTRRAAENEVAPGLLGAEVGEGGREEVERAVDVGGELGAQFVIGLVFAGADDAVAGAAVAHVSVYYLSQSKSTLRREVGAG